MERRIYIKGLPTNITDSDLTSRFGGFGGVNCVNVAKSAWGDCRGFGHLSLTCDESAWRRCLSVLNGSLWKGQKLVIEEAKVDYNIKREAELQQSPKIDKISLPKKRLVRHAADMSLVNEKNVDKRKGWRRGKFGRPIAIVKLRKPDGTLVVYDPSHDINASERFYEGYHPRPSTRLSWFSSDFSEAATNDNEDSDENFNCSTSEPEESVEPVIIVPQVIQSQAIDWSKLDSNEGFSLSALLNLPKIKNAPTIIDAEVKSKSFEEIPQPVKKKQFELRKLMFDFESYLKKPLDHTKMLLAGSSRLESVAIWKADRSEIRKDFKKQTKAAKRQIRKKKTLFRPKCNL